MAKPFLPIIYVRGYAGTQSEVEETVDDPFYGFNRGSTHVRVGPDAQAQFFAFESPLVRLMSDHGYSEVFEGERQTAQLIKAQDRAKSLWISRYYDRTSKTFAASEGVRLSIEQVATELRDLIARVCKETGSQRVILVAHSMGGLVCRCLIQKIYPDAGEKAADHVHKLFTYGTPHGGIHFAVGSGILEWVRDQIGWNNADDFGRQRMYEYLTPAKQLKRRKKAPKDFKPNSLNGAFPESRVFCLVGTNAHDYDVAFGLSKRAVGPQSDGLVRIEHAFVEGAYSAHIHRTHSGRYGMVNSEAGFQNLQRFLFGDIKVGVYLKEVRLASEPGAFYQAEVTVAIRNLPSLVHERTTANHSPIPLEPAKGTKGQRYHLYTAFLMPSNSTAPDRRTCRHVLGLRLFKFRQVDSFFRFAGHLEQVPLWSDWLLLDVTPPGGSQKAYAVKYAWRSEGRDPVHRLEGRTIPLPMTAHGVLGGSAAVEFTVEPWS